MRIDEVPIDHRIISVFQEHGISDLFPPQADAFRSKVMDGQNLVLAVPTSSGKTLVSEVCMLKAISEGKGRALYLAPLRSLAREKYSEFKKYATLGIIVAISTGDYDGADAGLADADIIVMTTERADSLIRHSPDWLSDIGVVVVDEIHLVNDEHRGPTLEMVLAKLRHMLPAVQIVALSATISNADEIARWLNADLIVSDWRPVPLSEGVLLDDIISFGSGRSKTINRHRSDPVSDLVADTLDEGGQVLVFVSSRRSTMSVAKALGRTVRSRIDDSCLQRLSIAAKSLLNTPSVPEATQILAKVLSQGVAFHHAGLTNRERSLVEDLFKSNFLKVIVATPTLAAGVNLPARRTIIRDYRRYESGRGSYPIPVLEYKQMAGRAGRPKYDEYGEAILIAKSLGESEYLMDNYVLAEPENIKSKLATPRALRFHLLASIATGVTPSRESIDDLIAGTFFGHQFSLRRITRHINEALDFLIDSELVQINSAGLYESTEFGARVSRLYVSPTTAILFRDVLTTEGASIFGLLHLICYSPDQPITYVSSKEIGDYEYFINNHYDDLLIEPPDSWDSPDDYMTYLNAAKTARVLMDWISERSEREITDGYNVGMGDVHRFVQSAEWLAYSATEIARVCDLHQHVSTLRELQLRLKYGVKSELLEIVGLQGIGRVRGRMLYQHNFHTLDDLYAAPLEEIARVPTIGTNIARSIKHQVGAEIDYEGSELEDSVENTTSLQMSIDDFDTMD